MNASDREACAELLVTTITNLNKTSEQQINGLLKIAITAAEAAHTLAASGTANSGDAGAAEIAKLAEELRRTAEKTAQSSLNQSEEAGASDSTSAPSVASAETFCEKVEASLNLAIQNSVANQQQLNTLGQAILAQAAALLFSLAGSTADGGQSM